MSKILNLVRYCLMGLAAIAALGEIILDNLFVIGILFGFYTIWVILPILMTLAPETAAKPDKSLLDYLWMFLSIAAVVHTLLAMLLQVNHVHDDALLCVYCGLNVLPWYVIPWMILSMLRKGKAGKRWSRMVGYLTLGLMSALCVFQIVMNPSFSMGLIAASIMKGATYGYLAWVVVGLFAGLGQEIKATIQSK